MPYSALASAGFVQIERQIVLVKSIGPIFDRTTGQPVTPQWKLPGGTGEIDEFADDAMWRELGEETGLWVPKHLIFPFFVVVKRDGHRQHFFHIPLPHAPWISRIPERTKDEEVGLFEINEIGQIDMFSAHRFMLTAMLDAQLTAAA